MSFEIYRKWFCIVGKIVLPFFQEIFCIYHGTCRHWICCIASILDISLTRLRQSSGQKLQVPWQTQYFFLDVLIDEYHGWTKNIVREKNWNVLFPNHQINLKKNIVFVFWKGHTKWNLRTWIKKTCTHIKRPDNPTTQLLPIMSQKCFEGKTMGVGQR